MGAPQRGQTGSLTPKRYTTNRAAGKGPAHGRDGPSPVRCEAYARAIDPALPFCSLLSTAEPLGGTASHARGCVLVSYPKRLWARNALASSGMPDAMRDACAELAERHGVVTRLVAHEGVWDEHVELTLFPQGRRHARVPLAEVADVLARSSPTAGTVVTQPVVLVCTHGVRDRCCARFGGALVRALRAVADARVEIREASHLGGDRFAPVVLVLPSGQMFGHLQPDDAPALVRVALGEVALRARYRGTLWRDPLEQLAEVAVLDRVREGGRWPVLGPVERTVRDGDHAVLRVALTSEEEPTTTIEVDCVREHRLVIGDCRSADRSRRGSVHVWRVERVR